MEFVYWHMCFQQYISSHESSNLTPFELCLARCYIANRLAWVFLEECLRHMLEAIVLYYTSVDFDTCVCQLSKKNGQDVRRKQRGTHLLLWRSKRNKLYPCFKIQVDNYRQPLCILILYFCWLSVLCYQLNNLIIIKFLSTAGVMGGAVSGVVEAGVISMVTCILILSCAFYKSCRQCRGTNCSYCSKKLKSWTPL